MCNDLGKKKNLKNLNIKEYLNKRIKRLYCLKIIETKQNIYDYTIENYKRKMGYIKNKNKKIHGYNYWNLPDSFKWTQKILMLKITKKKNIKETKDSEPMYDYIAKKYKRKIYYRQKNNSKL